MVDETEVIERQRGFYVRGDAGCLFAARAASDPKKFGWRFSVCEPTAQAIGDVIESAVSDETVSSQSLIFPDVRNDGDLVGLLRRLPQIPSVALEQEVEFKGTVCLGYRIGIGDARSYVTGFANLAFLPKTRRAPFTELTFRSKPRPPYKEVMKEAPPGVVHLADMDMQGMPRKEFTSLWADSHLHVKHILTAAPDLRAAAKTTFAIPTEIWQARN